MKKRVTIVAAFALILIGIVVTLVYTRLGIRSSVPSVRVAPSDQPAIRYLEWSSPWVALANLDLDPTLGSEAVANKPQVAEALRLIVKCDLAGAERHLSESLAIEDDPEARRHTAGMLASVLVGQSKWAALASLMETFPDINSYPGFDEGDLAFAASFRVAPKESWLVPPAPVRVQASRNLLGRTVVPVTINGKKMNFWLFLVV